MTVIRDEFQWISVGQHIITECDKCNVNTTQLDVFVTIKSTLWGKENFTSRGTMKLATFLLGVLAVNAQTQDPR